VACSRCHTTPNNYAAFSCTVCHSQAETNSHHTEVRGYVYSSAACYSCHPNGRAED
jgi:DnaJ-class molecular chaperone